MQIDKIGLTLRSMKLLLFLSLLPILSYGLNIKVIGPCSESPVYEFNTDIIDPISLGEFTLESFDEHKVPYIGNEKALNSLLNFPTGLDALEVISDFRMRAHGPCFMVDGLILESFPSEVTLNHENKNLVWFIGYSTMVKDQWIGQCEMTGKISPEQYCSSLLKE